MWSRGNERRPIFWTDADRRTYLRLLAQTIQRTGWRCLAFCLMGNHVHLVIETREPNLGDGMRYLHGCYARYFNDRYARIGHLFQGRYGSTRVESDTQLFAVLRYVALNPAEANFCDRPEDYAWSSYAGVVAPGGLRLIDGDRLLSYLAAAGGDPRRRYRELLEGAPSLDAVTPYRGRSTPHEMDHQQKAGDTT